MGEIVRYIRIHTVVSLLLQRSYSIPSTAILRYVLEQATIRSRIQAQHHHYYLSQVHVLSR